MSQRIFLPPPANNKKLITRLDNTERIIYYGYDNYYPQQMTEVRLRSPLIKTAASILEDFINGSGWTENNELVLNDDGETSRDLLNLVAMDYSQFNGFALHLNFNALGAVTSVEHIPFEYCRLGLPDELGKVRTVVVSNNWERDPNKLPQGSTLLTKRYPIFNPLRAGSDILFGDGRGQVLYFTGLEKNKYPLCTFDPIIQTGESDEAVQLYERNSIKRGFHGATLLRYPGKFESKEEKDEVRQLVEMWNGENSPGVTAMQVDEDFTGELLETIDSNSNSDLFELTNLTITNRVTQFFTIPQALMGISPEGSVFSQNAYGESYVVYNSITRNRRNSVARVFKKVMDLWADGPVNLGTIQENQFGVQELAREASEVPPNVTDNIREFIKPTG